MKVSIKQPDFTRPDHFTRKSFQQSCNLVRFYTGLPHAEYFWAYLKLAPSCLVKLPAPHDLVGSTGGKVCAVKELEAYLHCRDHGPGPLFVFTSGKAMVREQLITNLRLLCRRLGLDSGVYSSHSLRIGAATTAAARGVPDWLLKALGRWESECYQTYIHTKRSTLDSIPSILARSES